MTAGGDLLSGFVPALAGHAMLLMLVGVLVASAGVGGLRILTVSAKVLPRWCGAAVVVGDPPFVFLAFMAMSFLGLPSETPGGIGGGALWALPGLSWALVWATPSSGLGHIGRSSPHGYGEQPLRLRHLTFHPNLAIGSYGSVGSRVQSICSLSAQNRGFTRMLRREKGCYNFHSLRAASSIGRARDS